MHCRPLAARVFGLRGLNDKDDQLIKAEEVLARLVSDYRAIFAIEEEACAGWEHAKNISTKVYYAVRHKKLCNLPKQSKEFDVGLIVMAAPHNDEFALLAEELKHLVVGIP